MKMITKLFSHLNQNMSGQVMVLWAIALPVFFGVGGLAVDVGHLSVSRNVLQNAADAGAFAGATILASTSNQSQARNEAVNFAGQNSNAFGGTNGATTTVTFPTATSIRVTVTQNVPLFLMPAIGINTGLVSATALAQFAPSLGAPPGSVIPLGIICNKSGVDIGSDNCAGELQVGQNYDIRRYCGNYFMDGPSGNLCGNDIEEGEIFLQGYTRDDMLSTKTYSDYTYSGIPEYLEIGYKATALPANRNGWKMGMNNRLTEADSLGEGLNFAAPNCKRRCMIVPVLKAYPAGKGIGEDTMIHGFVMIRVKRFYSEGNTDRLTFIIERTFLSGEPLDIADGIDANSVVMVQLAE